MKLKEKTRVSGYKKLFFTYYSLSCEMRTFGPRNSFTAKPMNEQPSAGIKLPSPLVSLVPIAVLVTMLFFVIRIFGAGALDGGSQVSLITATAICILITRWKYRTKWEVLEEAMAVNIKSVTSALIILLLIGAVSGSWMIGGVVPTLIYYGLDIIHPSVFLASTCLICAAVSVMTGSSWATIATIGVALLGIGKAEGFSEGWIAGAIISGAYFGDKISPLSDTTVLAASATGTPLFTHIRYMMITTVPSMLITLVIFAVAGFSHSGGHAAQIDAFKDSLADTFTISPWLLAVPVITGLMIARRMPSAITLFVSSVLAGICMAAFQPHVVAEIAGAASLDFHSGFQGVLMTYYGPTALQTANPEITDLVATNGMAGMLNTIWLIICAMCFGGVMAGSGMLHSLTMFFVHLVKRTFSIVSSSVASGIFFNICTADQYLSIIIMGHLFKDFYKQRGLESRLLSRTTEDSVTVTSVLIPWNSCGMTQATVLGVATLTYLPYCFFNLISPLMSMLVAATGYKIFRRAEK